MSHNVVKLLTANVPLRLMVCDQYFIPYTITSRRSSQVVVCMALPTDENGPANKPNSCLVAYFILARKPLPFVTPVSCQRPVVCVN